MTGPAISIPERILLNTNQFLALNKPAGRVVQGSRDGGKSLLDLAEIYCKHPLKVIHRLDRVVTGVVVLAKNARAQALISAQFQDRSVLKCYWAIVETMPPQHQDTLRFALARNPRLNKSFVVDGNHPEGKWAELDYRYLGSSDRYHLLEVTPRTGRHHQIRALLAHIGSPVKGDVKYGAKRSNPDRSIHLHARSLEFAHPVSDEPVHLIAPLPEESLWKFFSQQMGIGKID